MVRLSTGARMLALSDDRQLDIAVTGLTAINTFNLMEALKVTNAVASGTPGSNWA